ncbi:MAG TPA: DUF3141 domain-containing protein [Methylocella sp.]|nr:DUF3141 domain-containing protein [Methylocella sp.]
MLEPNPVAALYFDYIQDAFERSVLFLDVLRQRGDDYLEQSGRKTPHVLNFEFKLLVDGRTLPKPVNYGLVEIVPPLGVVIDPQKRPFIVFDPRAGHGPGIGGMKHDSEIGVALRAGHPCYFVGFLPKPETGQTIEDVCRAEAQFVRVVAERHRDSDGKPVLIGNCQAGWQIMMMAAMAPDLPGPILIAGTPLSYWAGVRGQYPMRYLGGVLGGTWLTWLMGDLGNGIFDGAWLISNFESNNPSNTYWKKLYNVYANVDTEAKRFLDFEKWWGNPVLLNAEEIQFIVDELFVGNKLTSGKIVSGNGGRVDLRNVKSPIIVFCSFGDDITPPQQALNWILDLYNDVGEIIANGQTIIYSLHQSIGHLGIFVSGKVATKEHDEFTLNMNLVDVMPPGLYEMVLTEADKNVPRADLVEGKYIANVLPRTLDDIRALGHNDANDERRFETVARVSDINQSLYRNFVSPIVKSLATETSAEFLREIHPNRVAFRMFSDRNPFMAPVAMTAERIRANRRPVEASNPFLAFEKIASSWIVTNLEIFAKFRELMTESTFLGIYGSPLLQAAVGLGAKPADAGREKESDLVRGQPLSNLEADMDRGGFIEAGVRALLYVLRGKGADERQFNALEVLRKRASPNEPLSIQAMKDIVQRQATLLRSNETRAITTLSKLLPTDPDPRKKTLTAIYDVISAAGELDTDEATRFENMRHLFGMPEIERSESTRYAAASRA